MACVYLCLYSLTFLLIIYSRTSKALSYTISSWLVHMVAGEEPDYEPLEIYLSTHRDEIIKWINGNIKTQFVPTGEMFDRLANQVTREYPYGPGVDNMHRFLTNAIMCALWCGWFSQSRTVEVDHGFDPNYIERFRTVINNAFEMGRRHGERIH